jgi:hypothetical protein
MTYLAGFIVVAVKVSSILIGCVRTAPANRRRCRPGRGGVGKIQGPAGVYAVLEWQRGGVGKVADFPISRRCWPGRDVHVHTHGHVHLQEHVHVCVQVHVHVLFQVHVHKNVHVRVQYMYKSIYVYVYIHEQVHVHTHAYTPSDLDSQIESKITRTPGDGLNFHM